MSDDTRLPAPTLVERRLRYIERQRELAKPTAHVRFEGLTPAGAGATNRHGMPRLPIGQREVRNWTVLDLGHVPRIPLDQWQREVGGLVENPIRLGWHDFMALPQVEDVSDFHCVTTWSRFDNHWKGVRFRTIARSGDGRISLLELESAAGAAPGEAAQDSSGTSIR